MNYCKTLILIFLIFVTFLKSETVYRVPIQSTIDLGLPNYIERSIEEAVNDNADAIIFDLNSQYLYLFDLYYKNLIFLLELNL